MKSRSAFGLLAVAISFMIGTGAACSSSARDPIAAKASGDGGDEESAFVDAEVSDASVGFRDGVSQSHEQHGVLSGIVRAPNGTIPISGALVYISDEPLPDMKQGVHCDECVTLKEDVPYALTSADGSFELPFFDLGEHTLIVQKGGFRRVRTITLKDGDQTAKKADTTLPGARDTANGDDAPAMAIAQGDYDKIENSLSALGLAGSTVTMQSDPLSFLSNANAMSAYDIIFIPCSSTSAAEVALNPTVRDNLRAFAEAGGRVYVTDWSYDFVHQVWPGYVSFEDQSAAACSGCGSEYDSDAQVEDQGLKDWLAAQGITQFQLQANWTKIMKLTGLPTKSADGGSVTVTPKVWVKSQVDGYVLPNTVSFEQGCGRVLFSTYHTEASFGASTLEPQARALLYILLEVSVCTESVTGIIR